MTATVDARLAQAIRGAIYEGDVLIRLKSAAGAWGTRIGPLSPIKLAINPGDTTIKTRILKLRGMWGQRADPVTTEAAEATVAFETDDATQGLIEASLRAVRVAVAAAGGTATDEVSEAEGPGTWLQLAHQNIKAAGFSGKHANDSALAAGTDYALQDIWLQYGLIWIPATSSIAAGEDCKWTYTHGAVSGSNLIGNKVAQVTMGIELFGSNRVDGSQIHLIVHEAAINKATETDFAGSDYFKPNFSGVMSTPPGKEGPYEIASLTFA